MNPPNDATRAQISAARPDVSTWLAANAGSGKTRVLTDRVARLLLEGVEPQHILCLTYTKAAASEMQNRLFKRLGEWAMLPDDKLTDSLRDLGAGHVVSPAKLKKARTLFACAIETPGGLKIQTIHSFCASLLRRFPLEAGVSPQFKEIEDRAADLLRTDIVDQMAGGEDADVIDALARYYTGEDFAGLTRSVVQAKSGFEAPLTEQDANTLFGLPEGYDPNRLPRTVIDPTMRDWLPAACEILKTYTSTMVKLAETLEGLNLDAPTGADLLSLKDAFLYRSEGAFKPEAKTGSVPTKKAKDGLGPLVENIHDLMERVADARNAELAAAAAQKTLALHRFAARFIPIYEEQKQLRGWLDFDDLIHKARQLLTDPQVAAWVLYRIDGGIDHILVDEAQDTSPTQWDVIRKLAAEFSSGQGARPDVLRTIFVVGDKKQSIYSFQGADPREFDEMEIEFETKLTGAGLQFQSEALAYSFRSSDAILRLVNRLFDNRPDAGFVSENKHVAFKDTLPGRVDLWPFVEKDTAAEETKWSDPLDRLSPQHHMVTLARQVAKQIKTMIDDKHRIPDEVPGQGLVLRPVKAGDFLILVQRRSELFAEIIRACKKLELPIAGADRLKVGAELAVRDLAAVLSFLAVPDDSLSLATALKSPLFGWQEQDLFSLAHHRKEDHLWQALREQEAAYPETLSVLHDLRDNVDFLRPYDLIERILTRHGGRRKLLGRLGSEAEDGINALLSQALAYEQNAVPSLTGFLVWMQTDDLEIKRQVDAGSDQIRVMTVHGAKGLEAPIVILPDTAKRDLKVQDEIIEIDEVPVWKTNSGAMPNAMRDTVELQKSAQEEERLRLLYVALTRAEKWLIVCGAGDSSKDQGSWYQMVQDALRHENALPYVMPNGKGQRLEYGDWQGLSLVEPELPTQSDGQLDPCFSSPAPEANEAREIVAPSDMGGAKALPGDQGQDEETAKAYGSLVHLYLDHLAAHPEGEWSRVMERLSVNQPGAQDAAKEAQFVLSQPALAPLFAPNTLGEVAVTARLGAHVVQGAIDRLVIEPDRVLAVDFKTNRTVPKQPQDTPIGLLRQMGAYAHALKQIYPDRQIETAIVWTRTGELMALPHDIVTQALQSTRYLDDAPRAT